MGRGRDEHRHRHGAQDPVIVLHNVPSPFSKNTQKTNPLSPSYPTNKPSLTPPTDLHALLTAVTHSTRTHLPLLPPHLPRPRLPRRPHRAALPHPARRLPRSSVRVLRPRQAAGGDLHRGRHCRADGGCFSRLEAAERAFAGEGASWGVGGWDGWGGSLCGE